VLDFFLSQFVREYTAFMPVFDFEDHEGAVKRDDVAYLAFVQFRCNVFQRLCQLPFYEKAQISAFLCSLGLGILTGYFGEILALLYGSECLFDFLFLAFNFGWPAIFGINRYFTNADSCRPIKLVDVCVVVLLHFVGRNNYATVYFAL